MKLSVNRIVLLVPLLLFMAWSSDAGAFRFGINADNWDRQITKPAFGDALKQMGCEFIVWHLSPEEEVSDARLMEIVDFCRKNNYQYLFNTELVNYVPGYFYFQQPDGTYRYDLKPETLKKLQADPLFLGVVYDEPELMQSLCGVKIKGNVTKPYFADTQNRPVIEAHDMVVKKMAELVKYYEGYGKKLVFEMVFPDYAHPAAQAGVTLAPKLLKETYNDLMYYMYAGASIQYGRPELWACVDVWFKDKFPDEGNAGKGGHSPDELYDALCFAVERGFDYAYVEHAKALMDKSFRLTAYGDKVIAFQKTRQTLKQQSWKQISPAYIVRRFPDGYWGQEFSPFIPDHPYGSWLKTDAQRAAAKAWLQELNSLSKGKIPADADTWNALSHPVYGKTGYAALAGLPPMLIVDHMFSPPGPYPNATFVDLVPKELSETLKR